LIKHTHHDMDVDKPGKDSYELRKAGAAQTLVASQQRWALMTDYPDISAATLHPCVLARFWLSVGGIPPVFARPGVPGNTPQNKP
ncbi:molybdopterin-guanine dinucleotide biosynthesis protein MobB, partial [Salmonella enterica subsp. enterica serovar Kentucky]|nr:molybdopterin-guanine dinucleotide biosynthesis protein MobB [Salmonella enterica subsp. enterica serovar Kentucky]